MVGFGLCVGWGLLVSGCVRRVMSWGVCVEVFLCVGGFVGSVLRG